MRGRGVSLLRERECSRLVLWREVESENTMTAINVKSSVNIPTFDRENIHIYINKLKMWQIRNWSGEEEAGSFGVEEFAYK